MSENETIDVVVAGHICLDVIPEFKKTSAVQLGEIMKPGKLVNMGRVTVSTGGPVSNTGLALKILGIPTQLMGKVGDDFFGEGVLSLLREKWNAHDGMVVVPGEQTSYTIVIAPAGIDRIFLHCPGANDTYVADDVNYDKAAKAKLFHLGYPPLMKGMYSDGGAQLVQIYKKVKDLGATTSLDMSLPDPDSLSGKVDWLGMLEKLVPYVDILLPSAEESMFMLDRERFGSLKAKAHGGDPLDVYTEEELSQLSDRYFAMGAKIVVLKCGYRGIYVRTASSKRLSQIGKAKPADISLWANRELWEEAFIVGNVASATGSGDSSIAGFLASYLKGHSPEEAVRIACCAGGQNVQAYDALSGLHDWETTLKLIPTWEKRRQNLTKPGWKYDENNRIWHGPKDGKG